MLGNYITLDDTTLYKSAITDPSLFISNLNKPVVIDEIQKLPKLLNSIKIDIDKNRIYLMLKLLIKGNLMNDIS